MNGIQVSRRYKHFDWLHEQLSSKFLLIPSPPLPEKQVAGKENQKKKQIKNVSSFSLLTSSFFRPLRRGSHRTSQMHFAVMGQQNLPTPCFESMRRLATFYVVYGWKKVESWKKASGEGRVCRRQLFPHGQSATAASELGEIVSF